MTKRIGRFEIAEPIGQGISGTVYRGFDPSTGRTVTVETIALDSLRSEESRENALKAARSAGVLSHSNIAMILDVGSDNDIAYVVREFIEGRTLAEHIVEGAPFQPAALVPGLDQIADALDYAHRRGVVHGNFEPSHVVISNLGQVKITGFGIARIASKVAQSAHALDGAPEYMAPEKIRGEAVGPRSDVYSFGAMVYELLTGVAPFASDSVITTIYRSVNEAPVPPRDLSPDLSTELEALVLKALAKSPAERFENCRTFVDQMRALLRPQDVAPPSRATEEVAPRFCDQCGTALRPRAESCYRCGARPDEPSLPAPTAAPVAESPAPQPAPAPEPKTIKTVSPQTGVVVRPVVDLPSQSVVQVPAVPVPPATVIPQTPSPSREVPTQHADDGEPAVPVTEVAPAPVVPERAIPRTEVAPAPVVLEVVPEPDVPSVPIPMTERVTPAAAASLGHDAVRRLPPPLSGYAESLGEDLPAPGSVVEAGPAKPRLVVALLPWIVLLLILSAFAAVGFWIAPKILKPVPAPQPQTSSLSASVEARLDNKA